MILPAIPRDEERRLHALARILSSDAGSIAAFDQAVRRIAQVCEVPIAVVSFVGADRTWYPATVGIDLSRAERDSTFSAHVIASVEDVFIVRDARSDLRFWDNPFVTAAPFVRFCAGAKIVVAAGLTVGALCVVDTAPRTLSPNQIAALLVEARAVGEAFDSTLFRDVVAPCAKRRARLPDVAPPPQPGESAPRSGDFTAEIINSIPGIFYLFSDEGRFLLWNRRLEELTGRSTAEIAAADPLDLLVERDRPCGADGIERCLQSGTSAMECSFETADGSSRLYSLNAKKIEHGGKPCIVGVGVDISGRAAIQAKLEYAALHETLTGLGNRTMLAERLTGAMGAASRSNDAVVVVCFVDLDRFKLVNDTLGHTVGDPLLIAVATALKKSLRQRDTIVRLGGDEFVVIANLSHGDNAGALVSRLTACFDQPFYVAGSLVHVTASIGVSMSPGDGHDADTLLQNADIAMYRAKDDGGNAVRMYSAAMHAVTVNRFTLERQLREGIARGEFALYYQPVVDLETGAFVCAEALLRWNHPSRGLTGPSEFIDIAESTGLIVPLGRWVLREGARQARRMAAFGFAEAYLSVNISGKQLRHPTFLRDIDDAIRDFDVAPGTLGIELTESVALGDPDRAVTILDECKRLGLVILLDDFGTHYSSLVYLRRFPIDVIKIDKTFVDGLPGDSDDPVIVAAIVGLGRGLQCDVLAEGIENAEQARWLAANGCRKGTGYHFARPMPEEAFMVWLAEAARNSAASRTGGVTSPPREPLSRDSASRELASRETASRKPATRKPATHKPARKSA